MEKQYESPKLVLVGKADEVVLGVPGLGFDSDMGMAWANFEYEQD
jgi:hypothetical protein